MYVILYLYYMSLCLSLALFHQFLLFSFPLFFLLSLLSPAGG